MDSMGIVYVAIGLTLGAALGWLLARQKLSSEVIRTEERIKAKEEAIATSEMRVKAEIQNLVTDLGRKNSEEFLKLAEERLGKVQISAEKDHVARQKEIDLLFGPMAKSLNDLEKFSKDLEKERINAYAGIKRQITDLGLRTESLGKEASNLSTALRKSSSVRGDWGEIALRNLLEMAGMTKHTDFLEQKGASGLIPDVVVRLPGDGSIPIDAKTSGKHYLEALEIEDLDARQEKLIQHAKSMRDTMNKLAEKGYLTKVSGRADFVVMFVPSEALVSAAFEVDPTLHSDAMNRGVIITSPASLIALLRTAALYWQQVRFAEEAKEVVEVAQLFYKRMATWSEHFAEVGNRLGKATEFYNRAVGSWEKNVLPQGRKLEMLDIATNLPKNLAEQKSITEKIRKPTVMEEDDYEEE
jgi:DNA recombination protein RmuC|tara:strand:+ start:64 stop:1302 length:1239 start_codon:yes stop_codon:yes gene_type:complete